MAEVYLDRSVRSLLAAIIELRMSDLLTKSKKHLGNRNSQTEKNRQAAFEFFFREDPHDAENNIFSFSSICSYLELRKPLMLREIKRKYQEFRRWQIEARREGT